MGLLSKGFKESTKVSFKRVKNHILSLESSIKEEREFLIKQNKAILHLKSEIDILMREFSDLKVKIGSLTSSIGNEGVINNHQQSSTTINNDQQSTINNKPTIINSQQELKADNLEPALIEDTPENKQEKGEINKDPGLINTKEKELLSTDSNSKNTQMNQIEALQQKPLSDIKKDLEDKFKSLTDREFSVFMAVYQLEEQLPDVNYGDVAKMLNITEMTVRGYANNLISKQIPLEKRRLYNRKVILCIPKDFRELNLASFLLTLRLPHAIYVPQKTLKNY